MTAFLAIVKQTCRSVIRSHVFQVLLFALIFIIIVLPITVVGDGTALAHIQVSLKYCLGAVSFILSLSSIWLGCFTMGDDIETYQLHMVVSKPVDRRIIWLGKCTGIIIIHTILLIFSALLVYILILCQFQDQMFLKYIQWPLGIIMGLSGLALLIVSTIWVNQFFIKFFNLKFLSNQGDKEILSTLLIKAGLAAFGILIVSSSTFVALHWQFNKDTFSMLEKAKIKSEVLVGRRVFMPELPNMKKEVKKEYEKRINALPASQRQLTKAKQNEILREIHKQLLSRLGEIKAGKIHYWEYKGLNPNNRTPIFLRYRTYIGKVSSKDQRETMGIWGTKLFIPQGHTDPKAKKDKNIKSVFSSRTNYPEKIMSGIFHEIVLPPFIISPKGETVIGFSNFDTQRKTLFFQTQDGPKLLIKVSGFIGNYCRGIFMIFIKLVFLTTLACAIGGVVSAPVAIFSVISYLKIGAFASYLIGIENKMLDMGGPATTTDIHEWIGNVVSKALLIFIIPMQHFEVSDLLAGGELIEWSLISKVILFNVIVKGFPLVVLGIWLYKRREIGLVIKK